VLFTDGVDTASESASAYGTLRLAEGANLLVYPIQYDTQTDFRSTTRTRADSRHPQAASPASDLRNEAYEQAERYLRSLADRTGARHSRATTIIDVNQCFALIADELRHQYTLSYYSTNTARNGTYRSIRVSVDRPDAAVRARHGYRAAYN
jgi:VWFA-related protein